MANSIYDFSAVDWKQRDIDIAQELGCTKELVRLRRKQEGKKPSMFHRCKQHKDLYPLWRKNKEWIAQHTVEEIMRKFSLTDTVVRYMCRTTRFAFKPALNVWAHINLTLPTRIIVNIWGVARHNIEAHRVRKKIHVNRNYTAAEVTAESANYQAFKKLATRRT